MTRADVRVLYRTTSSLTDAEVAAALAILPADEQGRAQRFRFREDARDYAVAHALLRTALSHGRDTPPAAWQFDRGDNGKPFLAGDDAGTSPSFSVSHTRGMVACALAPPAAALGVDVESHQPELDASRLASRFFADTEIDALAALTADERRDRFYDFWTLKEAVVKALGLALPPALASVAIEIDGDGTIHLTRSPDCGGRLWQLALFTPAPQYRLAVAAARPADSPPLTMSCAADEFLFRYPAD